VGPLKHLAQVLDADAGVDDRGLEALVSERLLDVADAGLSLSVSSSSPISRKI